jgi:DNA invertase Pin-like site-specific DNA recombinase
MDKNHLLVGTSNGTPEIYHACKKNGGYSNSYARAFCGLECHLTPRPWDESRQKRQDSCHRCVLSVREIWRAFEAGRMEAGPMVAAYLRASTDRQTESPDVQLGIIETYCRRQDLPRPVIYSDPATSGDVPLYERPAGKRMLKDLHKGDHVVVARLDRLSRNFLDFAVTIDAWNKTGVTLHPCDFPMIVKPGDLLSSAFIHMLAIFASHERKLIGQRVKEGLGWRKQQGMRYNADPPWGFRHVKRGRTQWLEEDPYESEICIACAELHLSGYKAKQIADYLTDVWGIKNPRTKPGAPDRPWNPNILPKLIRRGLELMQERGLPLPEGIRTREDLRLR